MNVRDYRLKRALFGLDPKAVRTALEQLDQFYRQHELVLASHRWEMAGLIDLLKPAVSSMESTITALAPGQAPPAPPKVEHRAMVPQLPAPPRIPTLPGRIFGYQRRSVLKAWEQLRGEWERLLTLRGQEVAALEEQRFGLMMRMISAQQKLKELRLEAALPVLDGRLPPFSQLHGLTAAGEAAAPQAEAPAAPAPAIVLKRLPASAGAPAIRKPGARATAWRPGMVETGDGEPVVAPRPSRAVAIHGARLRVQEMPAASPAAAPAPEAPGPTPAQAAPAPSGPQPGAMTSLEAQVQAGLSSRLDVLFQRFLVGKVVGADLVLPGGQLLAAKGTEITREMVRLAEENGVLPALIAHMALPDSAAD